jgi:hypothetical protein
MTTRKTSMQTMQADALQAIVADLLIEPVRDGEEWAKRVLAAVARGHRARGKQ